MEHNVGLRGISAGGCGHRRDRLPSCQRVKEALWHSHVRKIEKRVNEKKKTDQQVDLEKFLQELNVSEEEKQKLKAKIFAL